MSSAPIPSPAPAPPERELQRVPQPEPSRAKPLLILAAVVLLAAAGWFLRPHGRPRPAASAAVRTVKPVRGMLQRTLRLSGTIGAVNFANIFAPRLRAPDAGRGLVLLELPSFGSMVKKGDVIARIDGKAVADHLDDVEAMVDQTYMDLKKLRSQQVAEREALEQSVRVARANWEKAQQDMLALDVRSAIQREQLKLALEEAKANYDEVRRELPLLAERQQAEWRVAEISQESQVRHRDRHSTDLAHLTIRAPIAGQVVMRTIYRNGEPGQVKLGDELAPGQPFMRIVDLSRMEVDATMSQSDSELLRLGQKATIRFDAYPDLVVAGTVQSVGTLAVSASRRTSYYVRQVPVRIAIEGKDPRVIPDLTASADVVVGQQDDALIIPRQAVQENAGRTRVYVKQGENVVPREVELGLASNTQVSVISGLQEGDQVALP